MYYDRSGATPTTVPIDADDYIFSILHGSSADLKAIGGGLNPATYGVAYTGYPTFNAGTGEGAAKTSKGIPFSGVSKIGQYEFSVTINGARLPYFYELTLAAVGPTPLHVFAPDATIKDDGAGAYIDGTYSQAVLSANVDTGTAKGGFRWQPTVFSGPYYLVSYNDTNKQAVLKVNPHYRGQFNYEPIFANGILESLDYTKPLVYKPNIETINMVKTTSSTQFSQLTAGEVDLLNTINGGTAINEGKALTGISHHTFARNGYGFIHFHSDIGPTQYVEVRQAVAYLLDRTTFAQTYTGGYGEVVHGPYGVAMWMFQDTKDQLAASLNTYAYNVDTARETLISGGWVLDDKGNAYTGVGVRHKLMKDGKTLMPLEIEWLSTPDNPVSELIAAMLPSEAVKVGMKINQSVQEFAVLLDHYYGDVEERQYHMFNLATNFTPVYDQYFAFHPGYVGSSNVAMLTDSRLFYSYKALREYEATQTAEYAQEFVKSVVEWNRLLPQVPLYSDLYHDFYVEELQDLRTTSLWNWQFAVVAASMD